MKLKYLVSAAAVAALVGCSPAPSTAVVADGRSYTRAEVADMAKTCESLMGLDSGAITETFAARAIAMGGVIGAVEAEFGQIDPQALDSMFQQMAPGAAGAAQDEHCAPVLVGYAKAALVQNSGQMATLADAVDESGVVLNPMYGRISPDEEAFFRSSSLSVRVSQ